jgi:hypothetical protein
MKPRVADIVQKFPAILEADFQCRFHKNPLPVKIFIHINEVHDLIFFL